jgi:hypothetical protein
MFYKGNKPIKDIPPSPENQEKLGPTLILRCLVVLILGYNRAELS